MGNSIPNSERVTLNRNKTIFYRLKELFFWETLRIKELEIYFKIRYLLTKKFLRWSLKVSK